MAPNRSTWSRATLVVSLYAAMAIAGVVWGAWQGRANLWRFPHHPGPSQMLLGSLMGVIVGLGFVFLSRLAVHRYAWARSLHRDFRARLGPLPHGEVMVLAGASSLGEELFFRGALLPATGILVSSLVFALLHIGPRLRYLPWTLSSFVAGVVFAQLFIWSGDLTGPIVAHFTVNYLNLGHLRDTDLRS